MTAKSTNDRVLVRALAAKLSLSARSTIWSMVFIFGMLYIGAMALLNATAGTAFIISMLFTNVWLICIILGLETALVAQRAAVLQILLAENSKHHVNSLAQKPSRVERILISQACLGGVVLNGYALWLHASEMVHLIYGWHMVAVILVLLLIYGTFCYRNVKGLINSRLFEKSLEEVILPKSTPILITNETLSV